MKLDRQGERLNNGDIHDRAGNAASLSHPVVTADPSHRVTTAPDN